MNDRLFDQAVSEWLETGSDRTPPAAIDAVLLAVKSTPQERDLRISWRFNQMPTYLRLAAGVAIVAILGVGALTLVNGPGFGGLPTPAPSSSATPTIAPTAAPSIGSTTFTSARYGYTLRYPDTWTAKQSDRAWSMEVDRNDWLTTAADGFRGPERIPYLTAFAAPLAPAASVDDWIATYHGAEGLGSPEPCARVPATASITEVDGHPVTFFDEEDSTDCGGKVAFVVVEDQVYVFTVWLTGAEGVLDEFLPTVTFQP